VSPISQAMVENRLKYLEFQQQQMANADIGRTGAEPVDPRRIGTTNNQQPTANSQSRTANRQQPTASGGPEGVA
jgi:hypothetical protein